MSRSRSNLTSPALARTIALNPDSTRSSSPRPGSSGWNASATSATRSTPPASSPPRVRERSACRPAPATRSCEPPSSRSSTRTPPSASPPSVPWPTHSGPAATRRSAPMPCRPAAAAWSCARGWACPMARSGSPTSCSAASTTPRSWESAWPSDWRRWERATCSGARRRWPLKQAERAGRVHLVGAGPGDPGLLTARALELIARADTILYDRLIPAQALDGARPDAELLFVGKQGGGQSVPQEQTQALMIERARAGREVVRLKGGDPFVFGRGGEEALALREADIEFGVVPGVTAGVSAAAYAGIPVTHRGISTGVALVTGHEDPAKAEQELDWSALAAFPGTLVFYMGVRSLERIAGSLIDAGRSPSQAAAVVERGTFPDQRTVTGTLATIAELAARASVQAPAIAIVGDVVDLAGSLSWGDERPLRGRSVAVTRARAQASGLARRLEELGASVVQTPTIRTREISDPTLPPLDPASYDLICLTSANGVQFLFKRLAAGGRDARALAGARIAAIGPGTAAALAQHGIVADVIPERFVAESLVEALSELEIG